MSDKEIKQTKCQSSGREYRCTGHPPSCTPGECPTYVPKYHGLSYEYDGSWTRVIHVSKDQNPETTSKPEWDKLYELRKIT